jgi:AraC family transcriptional activator of pobA
MIMSEQKSKRDKKAPDFHMETLDAMDGRFVMQGAVPLQLAQFELVIIRKGSGILTVDFQDYPLAEDAIYCLSPGQCRSFKETAHLEGYYISLSADLYFAAMGRVDYFFFCGRLNSDSNIMHLMPGIERLDELNSISELIGKEYQRNKLSRLNILSSLLSVFFLYLTQCASPGSSKGKYDDKTEKVMKYLEMVKRNFMTKKTVADYASELYITPNYLNFIVKQISGFQASFYIHQCIILEAKRLIVSEKARLKDLAYSLGFTDSAHFSKYFKNKCGVNFSSFRRDLIKQ